MHKLILAVSVVLVAALAYAFTRPGAVSIVLATTSTVLVTGLVGYLLGRARMVPPIPPDFLTRLSEDSPRRIVPGQVTGALPAGEEEVSA